MQVVLLGFVLIGAVVSPFNSMYYYIDEFNVYQRSDLFMAPFIGYFFVSLSSVIFIVFKYRQIVGAADAWALSSYVILLAAAMALP